MCRSRLVAISHPRMRSIAFFSVRLETHPRSTHDYCDINSRRYVPVNYPFLTVKKYDIINITLEVRWFGSGEKARATVTNMLVALLQRETYRPGSRQSYIYVTHIAK